MTEIAKKIVDEIEQGKLQDAKDSIHDGIKEKAAQAVDMKREFHLKIQFLQLPGLLIFLKNILILIYQPSILQI